MVTLFPVMSMPVPVVTSTNPTINIKAGNTITFTGNGFGEIAEVWCSTAFSGIYFRFPVVSQTVTAIAVQVPDNAIPGSFTYTRMISPGTGTNTISLTVTGKKFTVVP